VNQAGKYFRLDYRFDGKRKTLALGVYPDVTLKEAREKRDEARKRCATPPGADLPAADPVAVTVSGAAGATGASLSKSVIT